MAEAFPENVSDDRNAEDVERQEKPISVLLLATKWQFDTYGLSTVNKSLVNNLRVVDPEGKKIKITCAVVEEEKNIKEDEKKDAAKYNVQLKGAKQPRGSKEKPDIKWLDCSASAYYPNLVKKDRYDFIIGHVPYLANGPLNIRDFNPDAEIKPKVILMIHDLPRTTHGDTDEDLLLEWLTEADIVFSVGKEVEAEIFSPIASLPPEEKPIHKLYIPSYPLELFGVHRDAIKENKVRGTQNITVMTRNKKDLKICGLDFTLAATAVFGASKHILEFDGLKTNFVMITENQEDKEELKKEFTKLLKGHEAIGRALNFQADSPENFEKLKAQLRKSNLMILPLKPGSPLFGSETLSAIAAGVPVLVSNHSGMASLFEIMCQDESIVKESVLQPDVNTWKEGILQKLLRPEDSQQRANRLREELLLNTNIAQTHLHFIGTIVEMLCIRLEVEFDSTSVIAQDYIDKAVKFDVHLGSSDTPIDAKKYVLAFIHKLFLQREKIGLQLLTDYLDSSVVTVWQTVLSTLENSNRKLLDVKSGSLIFTLFCPTISSAQEMHAVSWIKTLAQNIEQFMHKIGVQSLLRIRPPDDVTLLSETSLLPRLREMKLRQMGQSEGYESMTQQSSDVISETFQESSNVMEWLKQQPDPDTYSEMGDTSTFSHLETITANHIEVDQIHVGIFTKFAVSESSGSIGIASLQDKPSLSIMYQDTDESPLILSRNDTCRSALFITISGQEYLAATSRDGIHLWNLANNTSNVMYKFKEENMWLLCQIDETTVACAAENTSSDDLSNIYILRTDAEMWTLSSTHLVKMTHPVSDMSFVKTTDGTACVLLSYSRAHLVQSVEFVGGKIRWQVGLQQMGENFHPWSICTDGSTVFVTDPAQHLLHMLSVDNGSVLKSINLPPFGLLFPSCIRPQGDHLYIGHVNEKLDTYCITKFIKPTEI